MATLSVNACPICGHAIGHGDPLAHCHDSAFARLIQRRARQIAVATHRLLIE